MKKLFFTVVVLAASVGIATAQKAGRVKPQLGNKSAVQKTVSQKDAAKQKTENGGAVSQKVNPAAALVDPRSLNAQKSGSKN